MDEEKKPKKKAKEKVDKSKTRKEKKKSPNQSENDEQLVEEQQQEVEEDEEIPVKVHSKGVRNQFVEDELKSFKDNFYLIEPGKTMITEGNGKIKTFNFRSIKGQGEFPSSRGQLSRLSSGVVHTGQKQEEPGEEGQGGGNFSAAPGSCPEEIQHSFLV